MMAHLEVVVVVDVDDDDDSLNVKMVNKQTDRQTPGLAILLVCAAFETTSSRRITDLLTASRNSSTVGEEQVDEGVSKSFRT
jgi:hypothetical protein